MEINTKNKIIKASLFTLALSPIATNFVPMSASELSTKDLPSTDNHPQEPTPQPPVVEPEEPSTPEPTPPSEPNEPEVPNEPPVWQPEVSIKTSYTANSFDSLVVKQSEVSNVLALAEVTITKTEQTFTEGVLTNEVTTNFTPKLTNTIEGLGVKTVTYTDSEGLSGQEWTFSVNVVPDTALVNSARTLSFNISNPTISLTQAEAIALPDYGKLIELCGVSATDSKGQNLTVVLPKQIGAVDVRSGKVGTHNVEFGIANYYDQTRAIVSDNPFIVSAQVEVLYDGSLETTPTEEGLVDTNQLKGDASNSKVSSNSTNEQVVQSGGFVTPNTGTKNNIAMLTTVMLSGTIALSLLLRNKRK